MILPLNFTNVITNMPIPACNYIHALDLPSNVEVYISDQRETTLRNKKPLRHNSILTLKKGSIVQEPKEVFITTVGTSDEKGRLQLESINQKQYWEINQQDNQSIDLRADVTDSLLVLQHLDKISNPYEEPTYLFGSGNSTSQTTIFDSILDCDKLKVFLSSETLANSFGTCVMKLYIDDNLIKTYQRHDTWSFSSTDTIELLNIRGKRLVIKCSVSHSNYKVCYSLQKFNKKV